MKHGHTVVRLKVAEPVNQDGVVLKITRYDEDGKQFYARKIEWVPFNEFDLFDWSRDAGTCFSGPVTLVFS